MNYEKQLIIDFISWLHETKTITMEEWYGPECETVSKSDIEDYIEEYIGAIQ